MVARPDNLVAAAWGFAEATVFVIVPDVWLTFLALRTKPRRLLTAIIATLLGAAAGGLVVYYAALADPDLVRLILIALPAIDAEMVEGVRSTMISNSPLTEMITGSFSGVPYKTFAAAAVPAHLSPLQLLGLTILARLPRFVVVSFSVALISHYLRRLMTERALMVVLITCWTVFYAIFFWVMPN